MPSLFLSVICPATVSLTVTICPASRPVITFLPVNPPSVATLTVNVWFQLPPPPEGCVAWNVARPVVVGTSWQVVAALAEPATAIGAATAVAATRPRRILRIWDGAFRLGWYRVGARWHSIVRGPPC